MRNGAVVITGGGGSLGRACAVGLARRGYPTVVTGRTQETLDATVKAAEAAGAPAVAMAGDAADEATVSAVFDRAQAEFGPCAAFINCAAVHGRPTRLTELSLGEWEEVLRTNLWSAFLGTRAALRQMVPAGRGSVVLVSSAGTRRGFPLAAAYAAAKSGLDGFARTVAAEVGAAGVRANVLVPGAMPESAIYQSAMPGIAEEMGFPPEDGQKILEDMSALHRACTAEEIAKAVIFLATDDSSAMTGQALVVDGGLTV